MTQINHARKLFSSLFSDKGLTKKAYLNLLTVVLDYGASLVVGFIITPLMVRGLGNFVFGMWQVLVRLIGYLTPASGRVAFALKATIANQQASTDYDQKRRYIGSTLLIWLLFLPILVGIGGTISWFVPYWVHATAAYVWIARSVAGLLGHGYQHSNIHP
jgi:O-antigen/teichoic acid export membrane protein